MEGTPPHDSELSAPAPADAVKLNLQEVAPGIFYDAEQDRTVVQRSLIAGNPVLGGNPLALPKGEELVEIHPDSIIAANLAIDAIRQQRDPQ